MPANVDLPIYCLNDLPADGLVLWSDFLSTGTERRVIPVTNPSWRRMVARGEAPPIIKFAGRNAAHVDHIRAIALGQDWRTVEVAS